MLTPKVLPSDINQYQHEIWKIERDYGSWKYSSRGPSRILLDSTPEEIKKRYRQLQRKVRDFKKIPVQKFFLGNDMLYTLWCNRESSDSITAKELYEIVIGISDAIDKVATDVAYSSYDGR